MAVRATPDRTGRRVTVLTQFRDDFRPRVVLAVAVRRDGEGRPAWYRISLPGRPNGRTGWVPAASVDLKPVRRRS